MRLLLSVVAAFLFLATTASAQVVVEVTPFGGYRFGGSFTVIDGRGALDIKESGTYGASLGFRVDEDGELEASFTRQSTRLRVDGFFTSRPVFDLAVENYHAGGNYLFRDEDVRVRPYIGVGLGVTRLVPEPEGLESETRFSASFAFGMKAYFGAHFGLRLEARGFFTVLDSDSTIFCDSLSGCFVRTSGTELSQGEVRGGLIFRF
jgi:Outer membrane protein beta-barrel domain